MDTEEDRLKDRQVVQWDRHNPSVSQTDRQKGKRRFKASVVDTSLASPLTVSL